MSFRKRGLVLLGLFAVSSSLARAGDPIDPDLFEETLNDTDLVKPTSMVFLGPDEVLVSEKFTGQVKHLKDWQLQGVALDVDVANASGTGFLCLELHPDFEVNQWVFCYYSTSDGADGGNWTGDVVERYTWDGTNLVNGTGPLFSINPTGDTRLHHHGGQLRFGPDGRLYGQVGEMGLSKFTWTFVEHNTGTDASGRGAIFRIEADGSIPLTNPFINETDPRLRAWWMYGFRNSFGMGFDPLTNNLWSGDNGPELWDELNRVDAGMNSGWVLIAGPDARDAIYNDNGFTPSDAADLIYLNNAFYRDPEFSWYNCIGVTSVCFLDSKRFKPSLRNTMIVGSSSFPRHVYQFELTADRKELVLTGGSADKVADDDTERDQHLFMPNSGTCTDLRVGPYGYLYQLDYSTDVLRRVRPLSDFLEPDEFTVEQGTLLSGDVGDLAAEDGEVVVVGKNPPPPPHFALRQEHEISCKFQVYSEDPTQIDLLVKTRNSITAGQIISIWDVSQSKWQRLDSSLIGTTAQLIQLDDLPSPVDYVDPSDRTVKVRITETRLVNSPTGTMRGRELRSQFDSVRLRVAYR